MKRNYWFNYILDDDVYSGAKNIGNPKFKKSVKKEQKYLFCRVFFGYTSTSPKRTSWWFNLYLNQSLEANPLSVRSSMTKTLWSLCENCIGPANKLGNFSSVLEVLENPWYNFGIFSTMGLRGNLSLMNFCKSLKNITAEKNDFWIKLGIYW